MKKTCAIWLSAALLSLAACSAETPATPAPPPAVERIADEPPAEPTPRIQEAPTIVMLGDSLTAGFGLSPDQALPAQVDAKLSAKGVATRIVNAGVSGDTTANGLARYDWSVASAEPDLLVVALGANDYLLGLSSDVARANLERILARADADGVPVILAGLAPRVDAPAGSRDAAFAAIYPDLSNQFDAPLYPAILNGVRDNPELLQPDGLHPTADGVAVMADKLAAFLTPHIEALGEAD